jgi:nucleoside-diphosphate-sugar epimerase
MSSQPNGGPRLNIATDRPRACVVTGVTGYLGHRVKAALQQRGWRVIGLTRHPRTGSDDKLFHLGEEIAPSVLAGAQALVHCAYDFIKVRWADIHCINVAGSEKLLRAARAAGIDNLVYISSISAFEGCRALYGQAKLQTEFAAARTGATIIRPGLIWSNHAGSTFGRLVRQVEKARVLPLFGGGRQVQYPAHETDLTTAICDFVEKKLWRPGLPIVIAHEHPWTFRDLLAEIARAKGKKVFLVSAPWRLGWATLKLAELASVGLGFTADNLVSLMFQNPNPSFAAQRELKINCRPFHLEAERGI